MGLCDKEAQQHGSDAADQRMRLISPGTGALQTTGQVLLLLFLENRTDKPRHGVGVAVDPGAISSSAFPTYPIPAVCGVACGQGWWETVRIAWAQSTPSRHYRGIMTPSNVLPPLAAARSQEAPPVAGLSTCPAKVV
jgi:hypothetical protein